MREVEQAVRSHATVQEARKAVEAAKERRDTVAGEVEALEADLEALEARVEAVTEAGDPEGNVRELSRQRRALRDKLEDASADLRAQDNAVAGAVRSEARAALEAMPEVWDEEDVTGTGERVREALDALAAALEELDAHRVRYKALTDWARHLVSRILDGKGQMPQMEEPTAGLAPADLVALARVVRGVRAGLETEPEQVENAA